MNQSTETTLLTRLKVGIFTLLGLLLIGAMTVFVNDRPFWWRQCQLVHIVIEDGSGLKSKSPVKSLGIEIGYLQTVDLAETHVNLGICITAPVEVLPNTRAYIKAEGFLGDKFVELKPVRYIGDEKKTSGSQRQNQSLRIPAAKEVLAPTAANLILKVIDWIIPSANAAPDGASSAAVVPVSTARSREIPVGEQTQDLQNVVKRVDDLVNQMTGLTSNLKTALNPEELRITMKQLNKTLENASKTLSPEGGLNQTAQRSLGKLEDAIEQLRDQMTRVNKGEGSVGMLLNDPSYADEIHDAIKNVNRLLSKVGGTRFVVDMGGGNISAYDGGRGYFTLQIYPRVDRYYLVGVSVDPRGQLTRSTITTTAGGLTSVVNYSQSDASGFQLTGMLGKILYKRYDIALGALNSDGALSIGLRLGATDKEEMWIWRTDFYSRGAGLGADIRTTLQMRPWLGVPHSWNSLYLKAGFEGVKQVGGKIPFFYGAGVTFDDDDIKILFSLR